MKKPRRLPPKEPQHRPQNPTLAAVVRELQGQIPWTQARELCRSGRVTVDGEVIRNDAARVSSDQKIEISSQAPRLSRGTLSIDRIVYVDSHIVVVDKPAGVLTVPYDENDKDTLVDMTRAALRKRARSRGITGYDPMLGAVQRLDKDTTGILVFARTLDAKRHLAQQLRVHTVERRYLALVHGTATDARHETQIIADRGDGLRGSWGVWRAPRGKAPSTAQRAITHVRVLDQSKRASLVECRLETGRQHQIRIHLSEAGNPLIGESVYIRDFEGARIGAKRPMLHARVLGFIHPHTAVPQRWISEPPEDFRVMCKALGLSCELVDRLAPS